MDEDGDFITVNIEEELKESMRYMMNSGSRILKFHIFPDHSQQPQKQKILETLLTQCLLSGEPGDAQNTNNPTLNSISSETQTTLSPEMSTPIETSLETTKDSIFPNEHTLTQVIDEDLIKELPVILSNVVEYVIPPIIDVDANVENKNISIRDLCCRVSDAIRNECLEAVQKMSKEMQVPKYNDAEGQHIKDLCLKACQDILIQCQLISLESRNKCQVDSGLMAAFTDKIVRETLVMLDRERQTYETLNKECDEIRKAVLSECNILSRNTTETCKSSSEEIAKLIRGL